MKRNKTVNTYGKVSQAFHWISAILIILMILLGLTMTNVESNYEVFMYKTHVAIGLILFPVTFLRLMWLPFNSSPPLPIGLSKFRGIIFKLNHILLYLTLILLLLSGLSMIIFSGLSIFPENISAEMIKSIPPRSFHHFVSKVFIFLLLMHIVGVFQYQFKKDDVFSRMGIKGLKKYSPNNKNN